ncbi:MAG TPA: hypothetical protein VK102_11375 [Sphingobacterium sp.]|nr:hypothetical protein [Sphingobacterium sp.]
MKKVYLPLLLSMFLFLGSCTKEYNDYYDLVPTITMVYEQVESDWEGVENDAHLTLSVPELDQYYIDQGVVSVAMSVDNEKTYHTIPGTIDGVSYWYRYSKGEVTIHAQDPILEDDIYVEVPQRAFFKVSLTESDWVE